MFDVALLISRREWGPVGAFLLVACCCLRIFGYRPLSLFSSLTHSLAHSLTYPQTLPTAMERSNWKQVFSKSKQRYYWFNEASGQTQWTEPPAVSAAAPGTTTGTTTGTTIGTTGTGTNVTGTDTGTGTKSDEGSTSDDNKKRKRDDVILATTSGSSRGSSSDPSSSNNHPRAAPRAYTLPKVAIIVPFRDLHHEQKRAEHLARFIPEMAR